MMGLWRSWEQIYCQDMYCTASKFVLWEIALLSLITGYRLWATVAMLTLQPLLVTKFLLAPALHIAGKCNFYSL